ncbi:hypothetical protein ETN89_21060 (plasmid) [Photobacterium damselae subsp. damselae]|uniref:protein kinase domain-containing protein n=1 Tax=Photobacterium damselae TaxID=38293 RepID=UPI000A2FEB80|nr:hypothetical protein [Photobacterium damselae]ARR51729.1 hypothetical protein CAY62_20140 [Photobacterium damselae subsp. damselae]QAY37705.1 hypothetical protein ETN89_21060 [Photobacterium damselae subsp. damselae]
MTFINYKTNTYNMDKLNGYNTVNSSENITIKAINNIGDEFIKSVGGNLNDTILLAKKIDSHRKKIKLSESDLINMKFSNGGVNKDKNTSLGVLYAKNKVGENDFYKEDIISKKYHDNFVLSSMVSLQTKEGLPETLINNKYATFAVYDDSIQSEMLSDLLLKGVTINQAKSLSCQLIDILKTLYINKISHNDLHKENILILKEKDQNALLMKIIDFGRSKFNEDFKEVMFNDINYIFFNQGCSVLETTARNILTPVAARMHYSPAIKIKQKHKPLHAIIKSCRNININVDKELSNIGDKLKGSLIINQNNYMAFEEAKKNVCQLISSAFGINEK